MNSWRLVSILSFAGVLSLPGICQQIVTGKLLVQGDETPIAYANIGIINSTIGTISNGDGSFEIIIPDEHRNDSLLVAALGFDRKSFAITELKSPCIIYLTENVILLHNIVVKSRKIRPANSAVLGNKFFNASSIYTDSIAAGSAMALLIENKPPNLNPELRLPYYVNNARLRISHNSFEKFKVRVRFLSVDSLTGLPGNDLVDASIIATSTMSRGWLNVDLTRFNIVIYKPAFFVAFEWLVEDEDRQIVREQYAEFRRQFPHRVTVDTVIIDGEKTTINNWHGLRAGTAFGSSSLRSHQSLYKCYFRNNSYGTWKRSSFILAATITVSNYSNPAR
jgi:hypothetical protein